MTRGMVRRIPTTGINSQSQLGTEVICTGKVKVMKSNEFLI